MQARALAGSVTLLTMLARGLRLLVRPDRGPGDPLSVSCQYPGAVVVPDPRLVAAIVDRVTFNAHILETGTQSYRLRTSKTTSRGRKPG